MQGLEDHLGIRHGSEDIAFGLEGAAQRAVVVDFAIVDQHALA